MSTFDDVTNTFITGLDKITSYLPEVVSRFQQGDRTFRQHKDALVGEVGTNMTFSGLGAQAFGQAVERNITRSGQYQFKMDAFNLATSHLKAQLVSSNNKYDTDMIIPPGFYSFDEALNHYGYTELSVLTEMRDYVLVAVDMASAIDAGPSGFINWLDVERDLIISDMQTQHDKNVNLSQDLYHEQLKREGQTTDPYLKQNMQTSISTEDNYLQDAKFIVSGKLYQQIHDAITGWFSEITPALTSYNEETGMATAVGVVTVGELIQDLNNAPGGAPVIIYQTPNGGLMVATGNGNVTAQEVEQAIQAYINANGLQGQKVQVTLLGYQNGGQVAQDVLAYEGTHQNSLGYHIENMVLVGSQFTMQNPPSNTNYDLYVSPGDQSAGDQSASVIPINKYQWANFGANAVFNVGFGAVTGGPVGMAEGGISTIVGQGINVGTNVAQDNASTNIGFADPNGYFGPGNKLTINNYTNNATTNTGPEYYSESHVVPLEQGGEYSSNWAGLLGKTPHYDQSAYLDGAFVPDPAGTSQYDLPNSAGQVHVGSVVLQGPHPLSPPTYYTFQNGKPVPS